MERRLTATEFDCPMCHVKIPVEYIRSKTRLIPAFGREYVVCLGCYKRYVPIFNKIIDEITSENTAKQMGISLETAIAMRKEKIALDAEDAAKVDEVVDVMDTDKIRRLFRDNRDPYTQSLKPLQIMQRQFLRGLHKQQQKRIIIPGTFNVGGLDVGKN